MAETAHMTNIPPIFDDATHEIPFKPLSNEIKSDILLDLDPNMDPT